MSQPEFPQNLETCEQRFWVLCCGGPEGEEGPPQPLSRSHKTSCSPKRFQLIFTVKIDALTSPSSGRTSWLLNQQMNAEGETPDVGEIPDLPYIKRASLPVHQGWSAALVAPDNI